MTNCSVLCVKYIKYLHCYVDRRFLWTYTDRVSLFFLCICSNWQLEMAKGGKICPKDCPDDLRILWTSFENGNCCMNVIGNINWQGVVERKN